MLIEPNWQEEFVLWEKGHKYVCGVDEVGRGALAGPVVAAAVIFLPTGQIDLPVRDSKMLSRKQRIDLCPEIKEIVYSYAYGITTPKEIDRIGIVKATHKAMRQAIRRLEVKIDHVLVDGNQRIGAYNRKKQTPLTKGDSSSYSIASASILAKVYRDRMMIDYHPRLSVYGFDTNVGYGTAKHRMAIKEYGLSRLHRRSFTLKEF